MLTLTFEPLGFHPRCGAPPPILPTLTEPDDLAFLALWKRFMTRKQQLTEAAGESEPLRAANKQLRTSLASALETIELLEARLKEEGEGGRPWGGGPAKEGSGSGGNSLLLGSNPPTARSTRTRSNVPAFTQLLTPFCTAHALLAATRR